MQNDSNIFEIEKRLNEIQNERNLLLNEASHIKGEYLSTYQIRPTGRHLLTIGEDLIQDQYAALVELVKNCYDADSDYAKIIFKKKVDEDCLEISIKDNGHGMSPEDVINKWLVPSTTDKLKKKISLKGRTMQGRKGIGRYAASILGDDLKLETIDQEGNETVIYLKWNELMQYEYLDQINIPMITKKAKDKSGTKIIICSKLSENNYWDEEAFKKLRYELKKLIPPVTYESNNDKFQIELQFVDFYEIAELNVQETIEPYPILELYDYGISGTINADGKGRLQYENQKIVNGEREEIEFDCGRLTKCGAIFVDIRVYDRDKDAIEQLISRGLKDEHGNYVTKIQARQLLNFVNGIGVYRNGFRIRPLGDPEFDWLKLNEQRVQNPSMKIGSNQVVGYVHVESEEKSGLEEKSARDGLKNNEAYEALKRITCDIISELEQRRFIFRRKLQLKTPSKKTEAQLEGLYDYSLLKKSVSDTLKRAGLEKGVIKEVSDTIDKEQEKKNEVIEDIKKTVAIYQGQATLGKIINIILHEGRRPLNYLNNQISNLKYYGECFVDNQDEESCNEILYLMDGIADNAKIFSNLFCRLDPLSAKKRETKREFGIKEAIEGAVSVFEKEGEEKSIRMHIDCDESLSFRGWKQDFYTIFVNLLDNSFYWIEERNCPEKYIDIAVSIEDEILNIDYQDSGPGISETLLENDIIFEPEFTTKVGGTGLGLAIAGESASRNGLSLKAIQSDKGAHFVLREEKENV